MTTNLLGTDRTTTRRVAVGTFAAITAALGSLGVGTTALARNNPRNDKVVRRCLRRCQDHDKNRCHERCRRDNN